VLGRDIFDKLLILRALCPEFPEALFFTTDFDEAYTIKSELAYSLRALDPISVTGCKAKSLTSAIPMRRRLFSPPSSR
jgi:hypothetical protein